MKILVTGSSGFVASHLCEHLVRAGHQVRAFLHYNHGQTVGNLVHLPKDVMAEIQGVWGDVRELHDVLRSTSDADVIYHLAALVDVPWSLESPHSYLETNLMGTYNILEAARVFGARVITASSSEVYGGSKLALSSISARHPRSPYAASKVAADALAESYHHSYGIKVVIFRAFNTFGPWQSTRALIPHIITQLLQSDEIKLGNLIPKRSITYVDDICDAYVKCLDNKKDFLELTVGRQESYSVEKIANMVKNVMGKEEAKITQIDNKKRGQWEIPDLRCDPEEAQLELGWKPETEVIDGIDKTVQWFQSKWKE